MARVEKVGMNIKLTVEDISVRLSEYLKPHEALDLAEMLKRLALAIGLEKADERK